MPLTVGGTNRSHNPHISGFRWAGNSSFSQKDDYLSALDFSLSLEAPGTIKQFYISFVVVAVTLNCANIPQCSPAPALPWPLTNLTLVKWSANKNLCKHQKRGSSKGAQPLAALTASIAGATAAQITAVPESRAQTSQVQCLHCESLLWALKSALKSFQACTVLPD